MRKISLQDHKNKIFYLEQVIAQTLKDSRSRKSGEDVFYNMDFGLLCPILFNTPSEGSNEFLYSVREWMEHVISVAKDNPNIKLVISAATLYEFYDQMNHKLESLKRRKPQILNDFFNKRLEDDTGISTAEIKSNLQIFSEQGYEEVILQPVNKFLEYLESGIVFGIGDYFESMTPDEVKKFEELSSQFLRQHLTRRLSSPSNINRRGFDDSRFHFRMDAINNALSLVLANRGDSSPLFVTPTKLNLEQCISGKLNVGRYDRVPLFMFNLHPLQSSGYFDDIDKYLEDGFRVSTGLVRDLNKYKDMEDVPLYLQEKIRAFYKMYAAPLSSHTITEDSKKEEIRDEITSILSDKKRMSEVIDNAIDDLKYKAIELESYAERIDMSYIESPETVDDPIVKKLKKNLCIG